jgi:hypothetical protein
LGSHEKIKYKIEQYNLIITRTGKGRTLVIMEQREYNEEIVEFISSNGLIAAKSDPMKTCQSNKKRHLIEVNPEPPVLKAFVKLHKLHSPIRPVLSYRKPPAYKVKGFIAKF